MKPFNDMCMSPMERDMRQAQMNLNAMREFDDYKKCINKIVENHIKMIDTKIANQNLQINKAVLSMTDSIVETTKEFLMNAIETGKISFGVTYDPDTESLYIGGVLVE